jgi:hypothetical protein
MEKSFYILFNEAKSREKKMKEDFVWENNMGKVR